MQVEKHILAVEISECVFFAAAGHPVLLDDVASSYIPIFAWFIKNSFDDGQLYHL